MNFIDEHNAQFYVIAQLIDIGARRIASKNYYSEGILLSGQLLSWLFTKERVGKELMHSYQNLLKEIAASAKFVITQGEFPSSEVRVMIIAPDTKEVYVATNSDIIGRLRYSEYRTKYVEAEDISKVELRVAEKVNSVISEKKCDFKALGDFCNVLKYLAPDVQLNSSPRNIKLFRKALNSLEDDDETLRLLIQMAPDLLDDLRLVYSNVDIYWG